MLPEHHDKIQQSIALLLQVIGKVALNPPTTQAQQHPRAADPFPLFQQQFKQFAAKGQQIGGQVAQLTAAAVSMFSIMANFVKHSKSCKQPDEATLKKVQELLKSKAGPILALQNEEQWKHHAKAVKEMINATFWVFSPSPEFVFQGAIEASEFNANKFRVNKVMPINEWYNLLINAARTLRKEVLEAYPTGITYNFNGTGTWNDLLAGLPPSTQQPQQAPQTPAPKVEEKALQPKKAPIKENRLGNWFIQHFEGQTIEFGAQQCQMRTAFFIENCSKCVIKIEKSKVKSVMISRSQNLTVIVKDCISGVEIMNCKEINCQILGISPSISIDKSEKVHIILNGQNKNTDILSTKVSQLNITYTINENHDLAKDHPVPEQVVTKWNEQTSKFESKVYDKFM